MSNSMSRAIVLAIGVTLAGCGGGDGFGVASTPPPPPPPPPPAPPPPIIPAATTSQQFTAIGSSHTFDADHTPPLLDADEQLQVRYVQSSNSYEVQLPHSPDWGSIQLSGNNIQGAVGGSVRQTDTQYSALLSWGDGATYFGYEAIGVATPAGGVPVTGSANYSGQIWGSTSEVHSGHPATMFGGIELTFDFGAGSLSGKINPSLFDSATYDDYTLAPINFRDTVYSTGNTTFSGDFDTTLPGVNSFSGLFTGPKAEELIGNFAVPYQSPLDGQTYQADGAFVGSK